MGLTAALCGTGECLRWGRGGAAPAYIASGYDKVATVKKKESLTVQAPSRALCFQAFLGGYRRNGVLNLDGARASGLYEPAGRR
mgnify:CR=1 FL=1